MTTLLADEEMLVNLTIWTVNDRFPGFTNCPPFAEGLGYDYSGAAWNEDSGGMSVVTIAK